MKNSSTRFRLGNRWVGEGESCFVIAEAGVSHFGSEEKAFQLIDLAIDARADAVKFQIYDVDTMISKESPEWKARLGSRALPLSVFRTLKNYCKERNIVFLVTAHDEVGLEILIDLNVDGYKFGSGEVSNWPFILRVASLGKPIILSTGMYSFQDVKHVVDLVRRAGNPDLALLHCVTQYPTPVQQVNLRVMELYRSSFGGVVGYSDHTAGYHVPLAAVALGAHIIEKHISLDFNVPNAQDWKVSCGPHNLKLFIEELRETELALGLPEKVVSSEETLNKEWACKSIVLLVDKMAGDTISEQDVIFKRPGTGIAPSRLNEVVGKSVRKYFAKDSVLQWEHIK